MLLMGGDRKKMVTQIMGDPNKAEDESPLHTVMGEFIDAVHAHDIEGAVTCLKSAIAHCSGEGPKTEE